MQTKHSPRRIFAASLLALTLGGIMTTPAFAATKAKSTKIAKSGKKMARKAKAATPAVVTTKKA